MAQSRNKKNLHIVISIFCLNGMPFCLLFLRVELNVGFVFSLLVTLSVEMYLHQCIACSKK